MGLRREKRMLTHRPTVMRAAYATIIFTIIALFTLMSYQGAAAQGEELPQTPANVMAHLIAGPDQDPQVRVSWDAPSEGTVEHHTVSQNDEPPGLCNRNQAVQDSVLAKLPGISQCSSVTGEHLRGLSGTLDISGQGITALSATDLQGMSGITGIDASGNQLSRVPGDLLQQLRHQSHTHSTTESSRNGYVIAVIDKSGSMGGQLSTAKSGARWLAANRPSSSMPMAVIAFSDAAYTAQDFTTETDLLNNAINRLSSSGSTNIDGALARAYSQAGSRPDTSLPAAIIVFSDGEFTLSSSLHNTMSTNSANGVKVSAISTSGHNVKMEDLAARGGGVYNTQPSSSQSGFYFPVETTSETTTTTSSHEPSITSLDLSDNSISSLPSGTFAQLPTLSSINLSGNSLTSVPPGLPAGLTALDLSDNSIGSLPDEAFNGLAQLGILDLSGNSVGSLPDGIFNGLAQLTTLDLSDNSIESLPDGVFNGLAQLGTLKMAGNPGAPFLFVIDLAQTGLTTVAATLSQDAPFPMAAQLTARHTTLSTNSVSIAKASKDGGILTMTPDRDKATEVTVGVTSPRFTSGTHSGIQAAAGDELEPEFPQVVSITVNSLNTAEGETVDIRVRADRADDEETTIRYAIRPDTNPDTDDASTADYADPGNGQVTIPSRETGADISITIINDQDDSEPQRETLLVTLLEPAPGQPDAYWLATDVNITLIIRTGICDRTPAVYEAVVDRLQNINTGTLPPVSKCSDVVPEHLPLVTGEMDLANQQINTLRDHDFEGLSGVRVLDLSGNSLSSLPGRNLRPTANPDQHQPQRQLPDLRPGGPARRTHRPRPLGQLHRVSTPTECSTAQPNWTPSKWRATRERRSAS